MEEVSELVLFVCNDCLMYRIKPVTTPGARYKSGG